MAEKQYFDHQGKPLVLPKRFEGTMEEFAALVAKLTPRHCGWPNGQVLSRQSKKPCRGFAMANGRCRMHNGNAARGPDHYKFKGDRLESYMPKPLAELVKAAQADPELLSIRSDVSLLAARQMMLLERLNSGESGMLWKQLGKQWQAFVEASKNASKAREAGDDEAAILYRDESQTALAAIGQIIQAGNKDELVWNELRTTTKELVDLKGREHTRLKDMQQAVYAEDVMNLGSLLISAVFEHVTDPAIRYKIGQQFGELLSPRRRVSHLPQPVIEGEIVSGGPE